MNAIDTRMRDPINSGLIRLHMYGGLNELMDAAAEGGRNPVNKHQIQPEYAEMSRLARDGTAEPVSREQMLRRERGYGNIHFHLLFS